MAVEEIELRLTVDGRPAQKALDETRSFAERLGGGVDKLQKGFGEMQKRLAPAAAAISGVSAALGQTNGEAGKAVAAIGQVAAAFAAGGPLGAGLAAGTFAVDALTQAWERELKAQNDAIEKQYGAVSKTFDDIRKIREQNATLERSMMPAAWQESARRKEALGSIQAEIDAIGKRKAVTRDAVDQNNAEVRALEARRNELNKQFALLDKKATLDKTEGEQLEFNRKREEARAKAIAATAEARRKAAAELAAWGKKELEYYAERGRVAQEAAAEAELRSFERSKKFRVGGPIPGDIGTGAGTPSDQLREFNKQAALSTALASDFGLAWTMAARDTAEAVGGVAGVMRGAVGIAADGISQLTTDLITGQEHAVERFGALIMQQAGQSLISSGTSLAGKAIESALTPGFQPLAVAQGAAAAGLIAGGIALGGAATAVMHVAGGGTIGQKLPEKSTSGRGTDPGARARPAAGGRGGGDGGTNLTIIYGGISGPSADDGARALTKAARRANRRGLA